MYEELTMAMAKLEEDNVMKCINELLEKNASDMDILAAMQKGMEEVGRKFSEGEYFLSELMMSAEVFKEASQRFGSSFQEESSTKFGTMVMGTVAGDIHDIGKDIVVTILKCNGVNVIDLGVDVPIEQFIEAIKKHNPQFIGMSCLLTTAFESMRDTVKAIEDAGLRDGSKILIGGGPITELVCEYVKADAFCKSAQEAVNICTNSAKEV